MSRPTKDRYLAPHCHLVEKWPRPEYADLHQKCPGPHEVRLPPKPPWALGTLVLTERCDCECHRTTPDPTRAKEQ
ncbi:hypothetical protein LRS74_17285 [Streptomyces sp. LX-29]|uniref:hypothetical protein n=1 Tax=Streptomyces sp. LX-29 TaxID=2900152 RepID=UPI00240D2DF0|nr:hypothetical protein [Streptomyces sp. LX-29]WFB08605.1 hypothetical protein LRS74_17285 [Streptomyces sp. LX-29]